ncbi:MAG: hypothetical protein LKI24_01190 [Acidipropionibacterium sp.]|jgi:hypothetical protein|nr:hypothetical protein [Acidipropionibacterium sp.]
MASSPVQKDPHVGRTDAEAVLAARDELGEPMEPALVDSFASKVTEEIQRQMELERAAARPAAPVPGGVTANQRVAVAVVTAGVAIPLTGIMMGTSGGLLGTLIVWVGLVALNVVLALRPRA